MLLYCLKDKAVSRWNILAKSTNTHLNPSSECSKAAVRHPFHPLNLSCDLVVIICPLVCKSHQKSISQCSLLSEQGKGFFLLASFPSKLIFIVFILILFLQRHQRRCGELIPASSYAPPSHLLPIRERVGQAKARKLMNKDHLIKK